ncbi:signal recognition particle-docking protein FtsY [Avibacterium paragallinarum]|uniref:signal recognition particle-docking protein FtsY n=1 Tax=Avibacterium paragallinarum TaxID=728 RepID=UPI00021AD03D|nr:signal recognition particle-docking protein FtsY [Avibacterium paragallinarum]AZI13496.1 signal recognition particle-docking protein FtsY [Avibacterium paragallinarum]QIR10815.1 signal recognition particle-docking protein FtsY [Avibacterium paragallinarum]QJE10333.1 signal recognition particle-docking protein FtsY [Avibacterium paragallinarum]QJE12526.1 signal recognition particle-docking protein FtsY [Avibacterium paragallinarum]QJE14730.1 signal recognition particle-docking protein FtsY [
MTEKNKKGGFWSWFGLGKKKEEAVEPSLLQENAEEINVSQTEIPSEQSAVENSQGFEQETETLTQAEISSEQSAVENPQGFEQETESLTQIDITPEQSAVEISQDFEQEEESLTQTDITPEQSAVENPQDFEQETESLTQIEITPEQSEAENPQPAEKEKPSKGGFFSRLVKGLIRTKQNIGSGFLSLFSGKKIDDDLFEELEEQLLIADIGMPTTTKIINNLTQHASRKQLKEADLLYQQLKAELADIIKPVAQPLQIDSSKKPYVILMVGVNGVGKTTTIGKLARQFQMQGKSVMLAAGDTFRAAAVEQLQVWGERNHIPVIAQNTGADSASVIYDAMQSAAARNIDILIADTAGRLQNKNNLMDELKKIVRVMKKYDETAPHEIMLTLDAGTGQNAISQAKLFHEAVGLTGISLTKLDGTAKGGVIFAIADQFKLPIRYIGIGEKIEDLRPFQAEEFIEALFSKELETQ